MNFLKFIKKYKLVIGAIGVSIAVYMHVYNLLVEHDAFLLGFVFALLPLVISENNE